MSDKTRVSKYISECGLMSRRAADKAITENRVYINDKVAVLGQTVEQGDIIKLDGKIIEPVRNKVYIMLNKPVKYLTSLSDDRGRKCVTELIEDISARVYPVGRLDYMSEGLLILTNDGEFANKLMHPRYEKTKTYHVNVCGYIDSNMVANLEKPICINGKMTGDVSVKLISTSEKSSLLSITLHEGLNREIRNICKANNLKINSLKRVSYGKLELGKLKSGEWRYLSDEEVKVLLL